MIKMIKMSDAKNIILKDQVITSKGENLTTTDIEHIIRKLFILWNVEEGGKIVFTNQRINIGLDVLKNPKSDENRTKIPRKFNTKLDSDLKSAITLLHTLILMFDNDKELEITISQNPNFLFVEKLVKTTKSWL
jgi:hypothetical protein